VAHFKAKFIGVELNQKPMNIKGKRIDVVFQERGIVLNGGTN